MESPNTPSYTNSESSSLIRDAITLCGHSVYTPEQAHEAIVKSVENERAAGKEFVNHLLYDDGRGRRKHNFPIKGVPAVVYKYINQFHSGLERTAFLGDGETSRFIQEAQDFMHAHYDHRLYAHTPGEKKTLSEQVFFGQETLGLDGPTFLELGDTPFFWHYDPYLSDEDIVNNAAVIDFNSLELIGQHFPRNSHMRIEYEKTIHRIKEPNVFLINFEHLQSERAQYWTDYMYDNRRTYDGSSGEGYSGKKKGGRRALVMEVFTGTSSWNKDVSLSVKQFATLSSRHLFTNAYAYMFDKDLRTLSTDQAEKIIKRGTGIPIKAKITNTDPATLKDLDSLEDWYYMETMAQEGLSSFYPYAEDVENFLKEKMPQLAQGSPIYRSGYKGYLNQFCSEFNLPPVYVQGELNTSWNPMLHDLAQKDVGAHAQFLRSVLPK